MSLSWIQNFACLWVGHCLLSPAWPTSIGQLEEYCNPIDHVKEQLQPTCTFELVAGAQQVFHCLSKLATEQEPLWCSDMHVYAGRQADWREGKQSIVTNRRLHRHFSTWATPCTALWTLFRWTDKERVACAPACPMKGRSTRQTAISTSVLYISTYILHVWTHVCIVLSLPEVMLDSQNCLVCHGQLQKTGIKCYFASTVWRGSAWGKSACMLSCEKHFMLNWQTRPHVLGKVMLLQEHLRPKCNG